MRVPLCRMVHTPYGDSITLSRSRFSEYGYLLCRCLISGAVSAASDHAGMVFLARWRGGSCWLAVRVDVPPRDREVLTSWVRSTSIRGVQADGAVAEEAVCPRGDRRAGGSAPAGQAADCR
jgi:hypothetical protein